MPIVLHSFDPYFLIFVIFCNVVLYYHFENKSALKILKHVFIPNIRQPETGPLRSEFRIVVPNPPNLIKSQKIILRRNGFRLFDEVERRLSLHEPEPVGQNLLYRGTKVTFEQATPFAHAGRNDRCTI